MARSSFAVMAIALLAAGCATAPLPPPTPGPISSAPIPKVYTCEQSHRAAAEHAGLPSGSELAAWLDDYRIERKALRAFHAIPEPAPCPRPPSS